VNSAPSARPAGSLPSAVSQVQKMQARAVEEFNAGRPAASMAILRRAVTLLRDMDDGAERAGLEARVWITAALNEIELHGFDSGLQALEVAGRCAEVARDPAVDVLLYCQRGVIEIRRQRLEAALAELDRAFALIAYASPRDQCVILLNRGTTHLYLGNLSDARPGLQQAADRAHEIGDLVREFKARHNLGYVEFLAGNLPLGLMLMDAALELHAPISHGVAELDRARVLAEAGMTREAELALIRAGAIFGREQRRHELGETWLARAECALVAGDTDRARRLAASARDRFRKRGNDWWRRRAELVLLQGDLAAGRPGSRLVGPAMRLRAEFQADGISPASDTATLLAAEANASAARPDEADHLLASLPAVRSRDPITARLHHRYVVARAAAARGATADASSEARRGLRELADYQARFGSIDLRTASAIHGRRLTDLDIELALASAPAAVFAAAERARAVSSRLPPVRPPEDPRTAELLAELRQTVESLHGAEQNRSASDPLLRRRRELEREVAARRWTLPGNGEARRAARLAEVRRELADQNSTAVTFVLSGRQIHALVVGLGRPRLVHLGAAGPVNELIRRARADLDVLANPMLPGTLHGAVSASFARSSAALDDALIRPLATSGRLVLVTTGALGQLPWSSLPSLRGVPVVVTPSATAWLTASTAPVSTSTRFVAIAGPDLDRADDEAAAVRADVVIAGEEATRDALASAMSEAAVVHIAAHGTHQTENPLFSSLRLADGPLFAHELDGTAHTPDHVVLSACEAGLATVRPGDEALGLTSVLLQLGTRGVISGVARVGDELAAETMTAYHRHLAAGQDSAAALAEALEASPQPAPFACFGASWTRPARSAASDVL
jgi:tetratricopeptide (TPR) repeat protein